MLIRLVLLFVLVFIQGKCTNVRSSYSSNSADLTEIAAQTFLVFYYGSNKCDRYPIDELPRIVNHRHLDVRKITAIYAHGFKGNQSSPMTQAIIRAYRLREHSHNFLTLDWAGPASGNGNYTIAVYNSVLVGKIVANAFFKLMSNASSKFDLRRFHLIGHSLGGQLFGVTGRTIIRLSDNAHKFKRITGLDPSNGGFPPAFSKLLSKNDATYVDIIHTDIGVRGSPTTGTVDFYPNGGVSTQPGCPFVALNENDLCSHKRAVYYYAESVAAKNNKAFYSAAPRDWFGNDKQHIVKMGIDCPIRSARGNYFLQTNSSSPYSLGMDGIHYNASIWNIKDPNTC